MLKEIFNNLDKRCHKLDHYFDLYERHFSPFRQASTKVLEIGVHGGGSLELWKKYFGKDSVIFGVDINPECKKHENLNEDIHVLIDDASKPAFWKSLDYDFDIIIDDGSHENLEQINALKYGYEHLKYGGVFWCEDTHTSYYAHKRGGGYRNKNSFTEYSKNIVDVLSEEHTKYAFGKGKTNGPYVDNEFLDLYRNLTGIHFYNSVVVLEKNYPTKSRAVIVNK